MEKFFLLTKKSLGFFFVSLFFLSCEKIQVAEPVATVPVIIPVEPPKVEPPVIIKYTITANAENGNISPKLLVVEKGGNAKFSIEASNSLVEPDYFEFKGVKTPMKVEDTTISLDKINEDANFFVRYKPKSIVSVILGKLWYIYSYSYVDGKNFVLINAPSSYRVTDLSEKGDYILNGKVEGFINFKIYPENRISFGGFEKALLISHTENQIVMRVSYISNVPQPDILVTMRVRK